VARVLGDPALLTGVVGTLTIGSAALGEVAGADTLLVPSAGLALATVVLGLVGRSRRLAVAVAVVAVALAAAQGWAAVQTLRAYGNDDASLGQVVPAVLGQACLAFTAVRTGLAARHR
jgi:hypothetical protein